MSSINLKKGNPPLSSLVPGTKISPPIPQSPNLPQTSPQPTSNSYFITTRKYQSLNLKAR